MATTQNAINAPTTAGLMGNTAVANASVGTGTFTATLGAAVKATAAIQITDYSLMGSYVFSNSSLDMPGGAPDLTEGVEWSAATSNDATAASLRDAINADPQWAGDLTASASTDTLTLEWDTAGQVGNGYEVNFSSEPGHDIGPSPLGFGGGEAGTANQPADGDTVVIGTKTYTFKNTLASEGDIKIGAAGSDTIQNVELAMNYLGTDGVNYQLAAQNADVSAIDNIDGTVTLTSRSKGVAVNSIGISATGSIYSAGAANLAGASSGTVGLAGDMHVNGGTVYIASADNTADDAYWVTLQAA